MPNNAVHSDPVSLREGEPSKPSCSDALRKGGPGPVTAGVRCLTLHQHLLINPYHATRTTKGDRSWLAALVTPSALSLP